MQIRELSKPITSKALNESLANKFGYKLKLLLYYIDGSGNQPILGVLPMLPGWFDKSII